MDIKEQIKSFEDALKYNGETPEQFADRTKNDTPDEVGYKKLKAIVLALNQGENIKSGYIPWFRKVASGVGLSFVVYAFDCAYAYVGARLLLKTPDLARYAGSQFTDEYAEHILG
jgi:hypothetical protein